MIPREYKWHIFVTCTLLLIGKVQLQGERTYDTSDWIPVTSSPFKAPSKDIQQQTANERILTLETPTQQQFQISKDYQPSKQEPVSKTPHANPTSRKLKYPSEYRFETPPPLPSKQIPKTNYYNAAASTPYAFELPPKPVAPQLTQQQQQQQSYFAPVQQQSLGNYIPTPSINPEVPPVNAPSTYDRYQSPVNSSFYKPLNPTSINDELFQSTSGNSQVSIQNSQSTVIHKTLPIIEKHYTTQNIEEPKQNVQLVYVPIENLKASQPGNEQFKPTPQIAEPPKPLQSSYSPTLPVRQPQQFGFSNQPKPNNYNFNSLTPTKDYSETKKEKLHTIEKDFIQQALYAHKLQKQLQDEINPLYQDAAAKSRRRPHQPPLAVFLESQQEAEVNDVLHVLNNAKTIAVQDTLTRNSPNIFIGPSTLESPTGYTKFPLPYLNNLNGNRIERKIDQLPFFVAPESYTVPPGYAKIPLPSPHVGSVVVSVPKSLASTTTARPAYFNPNPFGFSYPDYNSQNFISPNYQTFESNVGAYQSTPVSTQTFNSPIQESLPSTFSTRQPQVYPSEEVYNTPPQHIIKDNQGTSNLYRPTEESYQNVIQSTTPKVAPNEDKSHLGNVNSLDLAINNFELSQINNQFVDANKVKYATTVKSQPVIQSNDFLTTTSHPVEQENYQYTTERANRGRVRGRNRGTTKSSSKPPLDEYKYTVLEEFLASMNKPTESYLSDDGFYSSVSPKQEELNQQPKGTIKATISSTAPGNGQDLQQNIQFYPNNANIETIPTNIYSLAQPQLYDNTEYDNVKALQNTEASPEAKPNIPVETPSPIGYVVTGLGEPQGVSNNPPLEQVHQHETVQLATQTPAGPTKRRRLLRKKVQNTNNDINTETPAPQITSPALEQAPISNQLPIQHDVNPQIYNTGPAVDSLDPAELERLKQLAPHLFQPNFDQTYISLQDQAVRTLLNPNALPPTSQEEIPRQIVSSTEPVIETSPSTEGEKITTTTARVRTRGRVRGRASTTTYSSVDSPAVTSSPRRTASRRRPASRTTTERTPSTTEYEYREDSNRVATRQRTRTRGRPLHHQTTTTTTTTEITPVVNEQPLEEIYSNINNEQLLQPVQQYQPVEDRQVIAQNEPNYQPNQYLVPVQTTTKEPIINYENYNYNPTLASVLPVNVNPTEAVQVPIIQEIHTKLPELEQPIYNNNANIRSGGILNNNPETTTRTAPSRVRGRTRGRSRFTISTTSTTTTPSPTTRIAVTVSTEPAVKEEEEFYGFIRAPSYQPSNIQPQYQLNQVSQEETKNEPAIQFVGEIRPKYSPAPATPQIVEETTTTEAPRPRIRTRTRGPSTRTSSTYRQTDNEVNGSKVSEQSTRRPTRTRGRGSAHFRTPENKKRGSNDEDVASQNYPVDFLQKFESSTTPKPTTPTFQITVDPSDDGGSEDQYPFSSIYSAKYAPAPNTIKNDQKQEKSNDIPELVTVNMKDVTEGNAFLTENLNTDVLTTSKPEALPVIGTTEKHDNEFYDNTFDSETFNAESIQTSTTEGQIELTPVEAKGRRRGVWKLVRQKPVDPLEVSESQNYHTVINDFYSIDKVPSFTKKLYSAKKSSIEKNSYDKLPLYELYNDEFDENEFAQELTTTTEFTPTETEETSEEELAPTTQPAFKSQENIFETIYEMFGIISKPTEVNNSTTTTPEPTTTAVNPTFPEEITEESVTTTSFNPEVISNNGAEHKDDEEKDEVNDNSEITETTSTTSSATTSRKFEVEPWKMRAVKTSTSTEISHETEICYKGRCIKSKGKLKM